MYLKDTKSAQRPSAVLLDEGDGEKRVRLAANIRETEEDGQTMYVYDEAVFALGADREETAEDILEDFDAWWTFGTQPEEPLPTLEERVAAIEDYLIGGML